jgi:hypothetical protein
MVFLGLILLLNFIHASLVGNYQLYNSAGSALYDFSGNGNHAEVDKIAGYSPILTDRGQYFDARSRIEFPSNMFKFYSPTTQNMIIAMWFVAKTKGLLLRVSRIENTQVTYCLIDWEDNLGKGKLTFKDTGGWLIYTSNMIYCNFNAAEWNFVVFEYKQTLSGMQVNFYENLGNIPAASYTYTGFQLGSSSTTWGIKKALEGDLEGFFYEIWWFDDIKTNIETTLYAITQSKPAAFTSSPILDPYKTYNNISCSSSCTNFRRSCSSAANCISSCDTTCTIGCYDLSSTPSCIRPNLKFCDTYDSSKNACSLCMPTFTLTGSSCNCSTTTEKIQTMNSILKCIAIINNCKNYNYFTGYCSECNSGYYLHCSPNPCNSYYCVDKCPDGYYKNGISCSLCPSSCLTCTDANTCSSCISPKYFRLGECVDSCGIGYYQDSIERLCTQCSSGNLDCTTCIDGYYLKNGSCIQDCGIGYYACSTI